MSREKQIEEMALTMCEDCATYTKGCKHTPCDSILENAASLYNAGYRKQSVGEWVLGKTRYRTHFCSNCGYPKPYRKTKAGYHVLDNAKFCPNCGARMKGV